LWIIRIDKLSKSDNLYLLIGRPKNRPTGAGAGVACIREALPVALAGGHISRDSKMQSGEIDPRVVLGGMCLWGLIEAPFLFRKNSS